MITREHRTTTLKQNMLVTLVVLLLVATGCIPQAQDKPDANKAPAAPATTPTAIPLPTATPAPAPVVRLSDLVQQTLNGRGGSWAIAIKNLKTGESYTLDPDREIFPASLFKLAVMVETERQLQAGLIKAGDKVTVTAYMKQFNEGENNVPVGGTMTVGDALNAMVTYSDNVAAQVLLSRIGYDSVNPTLQKLGLKHTHLGFRGYSGPQEDAISAGDAAALMEMIYRGTLIDQKSSRDMLDLLLAQQVNDRLPDRLPPGTKVAHKTGNFADVVHDVGIVYLPDGDAFAIAMLGYNITDYGEAADTIALVARAVYDYFQGPGLTAPRRFPETGHSISGEFRLFWELNGATDVFGYPLTDVLQEDGVSVQYFQRARFELEPNNPPGSRIKLTNLGELLHPPDPPIASALIPSPDDPNIRYFAESGHTLSFAFKDFYDAHGGRAIFGYPITEQLTIDGLTVQYFQRARFEYHPENAAPYRVQLSLLGYEYAREKGLVR